MEFTCNIIQNSLTKIYELFVYSSNELTQVKSLEKINSINEDASHSIIDKIDIDYQNSSVENELKIALTSKTFISHSKVKLLLEKRDKRLKYNTEKILLLHALQNPFVEYDIIELLISHTHFNRIGFIVLEYALQNDAITCETIELLIKYIEPNPRNIYDRTVLHCSWFYNNVSIPKIKLILDRSNVNLKDNEYMTPLMFACKNCTNIEIFKLLLSKSDTTLTNGNRCNTLMFACGQSTHIEIFKLLLSVIDANLTDSNGYNALMHALHCKPKNLEVCKLLLHACYPNTKDNEGNTALMILSEQYYVNISLFKLILSKSDDTLRNNLGETALMISCNEEYVNFEIIELLLNENTVKLKRISDMDSKEESASVSDIVSNYSENIILDIIPKSSLNMACNAANLTLKILTLFMRYYEYDEFIDEITDYVKRIYMHDIITYYSNNYI